MVDDEHNDKSYLFESLCHDYVDGVLDDIGKRQLVLGLLLDADLRRELQQILFMHEALKSVSKP